MRRVALWRLLAICIFLLLLVGANLSAPFFEKKASRYNEASHTLTVDSVRWLEIRNQSGSLRLEKPDRDWLVKGKRASTSKTEELIKTLFPKEPVDVVDKTPQRHREYALTDDLGTLVATEGLTVIVGKDTTKGVLVRLQGEEAVYRLSSLSPYLLSTDVQDWFDKTIVALEEPWLKSITLTSAGDKVRLAQSNKKWLLVATQKEVPRQALSELISTLYVFSGVAIVDESEIDKYPRTPLLTIDIDYLDKTETLIIFRGEDTYLLLRQSDQEKFNVEPYLVDRFLAVIEDFRS